MTTLGYALLSLLACETLSGYDIAQTMQHRIGNFWHARHSQIYPELARLEEEQFITHQTIEQQDRPAKKIYTLTEKGRAQLAHWATQDMNIPAVRDELVLKAYALWLADKQQAISLFQKHEQHHLEQLAAYQQLEVWLRQKWEEDGRRLDSPWFSSYATLQRGLGYEREYASWCRWMLDTLQATESAL